MKIRIESGGTGPTTHLVDAETGKRLEMLEEYCTGLDVQIRADGMSEVTLRLVCVPVRIVAQLRDICAVTEEAMVRDAKGGPA